MAGIMTTRPNTIGINVEGPKGDKDVIAQAAQSIIDIFEVGFETHQDQATIQKALHLLSEIVPSVHNISISDCELKMGTNE